MYITTIDPAKYFLTKNRITEFPLTTPELAYMQKIVSRLLAKDTSIKLLKEHYKNFSEIQVAPEHGQLTFLVDFKDWADTCEEQAVKLALENCVSVAVRLFVEEVFFDER